MIHLQAKWTIDADGTIEITEWSQDVEQLPTELRDKLFNCFPNVTEFDFKIEYLCTPMPISHDFALDLIAHFSQKDKFIEEYFTH